MAFSRFARRWVLGAAACATVWASAAWAEVVVKDDRGVTVRLPQPPQRIVSLLPSLTETVCALGECARLVGTDRYSDWPESVKALPKLGGLEDAQVERVVALKPDVVIASQSARVLDRLEALGLKVVALEAKDQKGARHALTTVATLLGRSGQAQVLASKIDADLQRAAALTPTVFKGRRVYFEVSESPHAAGASSFVGEILAHLGIGNIVPASMGPFPKLNPEYIVRAQPDLIMAVQRNLDAMPQRPGWSALRALREHQTCGFEGPRYDVLIRPGPRMGEAALALAECLKRLPSASSATAVRAVSGGQP